MPWGPVSSPCHIQKKHRSDIPTSVESSLNCPDLSETPKGNSSAHHTQSVLETLCANLSAWKVSRELLQKHLPSPHLPFILLRGRGCWAWPLETGDWVDPGSAALLNHSVPQLPHLQNADNNHKQERTAALPSTSYCGGTMSPHNLLGPATQWWLHPPPHWAPGKDQGREGEL